MQIERKSVLALPFGLAATTLVLVVVFVMILAAEAAVKPSPLDIAFKEGDEEEVTKSIVASEPFKRAVSEAIKARDARKAAVKQRPKSLGITPAQAARVKFIEVLEGK